MISKGNQKFTDIYYLPKCSPFKYVGHNLIHRIHKKLSVIFTCTYNLGTGKVNAGRFPDITNLPL